jgi:hypothetical protein
MLDQMLQLALKIESKTMQNPTVFSSNMNPFLVVSDPKQNEPNILMR